MRRLKRCLFIMLGASAISFSVILILYVAALFIAGQELADNVFGTSFTILIWIISIPVSWRYLRIESA